MKSRCTNMNHGRMNAPVRYCPACGETINQKLVIKCDSHKHVSLRRSHLAFCTDCGKKL